MLNKQENTDLDQLSENQNAPYIKALQLNSPPFSSLANPDSFYSNEDRKQYLNHLLHIVQSSDLIQVVVGERGSGKSALLQSFKRLSGPSLRCCAIQAKENLGENELLQAIAACLDLPEHMGSAALLELLWEESFNLQRKDLTPVLIIDNAHLLPEKTLSMLLQLQSINSTDTADNNSPWRTILFSEPEHTVALLELDTRLHFIELDGLTEKQTADYLEHRLKESGLQQPSPFSQKDIAFIHKIANGNFNKTNELAHQVLLDQYTKQQPPTSAAKPPPIKAPKKSYINYHFKNKTMVLVSAAVVVLLLVILMYQDNINELVEPEQAETDRTALPMPLSEDLKLPRTPDPVAATDVSTPITEPTNAVPETPTAIESQPVSDISPKLKADENQSATLDEQPKSVESNALSEVDKTQKSVSKEPQEPASTSEKNTNETAPTSDSLTTRLSKTGIKTRAWILQQPATHFSAQLMGSSQVDTLIKVADQKALNGKAAIYKLLRNNKDWYVLIYGSEPSKSAMQAAVKSLPVSLQRNKPWIRSMQAIQAEVKSGKK